MKAVSEEITAEAVIIIPLKSVFCFTQGNDVPGYIEEEETLPDFQLPRSRGTATACALFSVQAVVVWLRGSSARLWHRVREVAGSNPVTTTSSILLCAALPRRYSGAF